MAEDKKKEYNKEDFDSPATKEMRNMTGMKDDGYYANKDYPTRDTKLQTSMKETFRAHPESRKYITANGNYLRHQAKLNLFRKSIGHSNNPMVQQHGKDLIARRNNQLAKEKMKVHSLKHKGFLSGVDYNEPNTKEVVNTMSMATGKPNLGEKPTDNLKSGSNVNSDVFKNKWDKNEW